MPRLSTYIVACALLWPLTSHAVTFYMYRDANGIMTFTDKRTHGAQVIVYSDDAPVEQKLDRNVRIEKQKVGSGEQLLVINDLYAPVEVDITIKGKVNVAPLATDHIRTVVPARSTTAVAQLQAAKAGAMKYTHNLRYALSNPKQQASDYNYPLAWDGAHPITQGPGGQHSHQDEKSRHAVDIGMPVGTPIKAARGGVVVSTEENQPNNGGSGGGNFVRILHDDGTMSVYLHLRRNGVNVQPGQKVKGGDLIAYSGNSGRSTGPHLHFVVQKNVGMKVVSIPFKFVDATGVVFTPRPGTSYSTVAMR